MARAREILEEIWETVEIASDRRMVKAHREGLRDLKEGRVRPYKEFARELRSSHAL